MKSIIKKIENKVISSLPLLKEVMPKKEKTKILGNRLKTFLCLHIDFSGYHALDFVHVSLHWEGHFQFYLNLNKSGAGSYFCNNVSFGSDFFNLLDDRERLKRADYFINNYDKLLYKMIYDRNSEKVEHLLQKKKEIEEEIEELQKKA